MTNQPKHNHANTGGRLFIVSAPSGAGKTTLCRALRRHYPDLLYSVSHTTRAPRRGEQNGVDYYFISPEEFKDGIQNGIWAEWAEVHGNYYGTSAAWLTNGLAAGKDILLDIDVQGTRQILDRFPDCITIFIMPPSLDVLKERLVARGTDDASAVAKRLENAEREMAQRNIYRHVIVNDELNQATEAFIALFARYRKASGRRKPGT